MMSKLNQDLHNREKVFKEEIDTVIAKITALRKRIGTKSEFDKKMHRAFDEAVTKLRQVQFLISKIMDLDRHTINLTTMMAMELQFTDRKNFTRDDEVGESLVLMGEYAEDFYYAAYRVIKIFKDLGMHFKAEGIEALKQFFYEHPEIRSRSIGSGMSGKGPVLKSELVERHKKLKDKRFEDRGLYANLQEFLDATNKVLTEHGV